MDAVKLLKKDHDLLQRLLHRMTDAHSTLQREQLLARVGEEIKAHMRLEEEIFYPQYLDLAARKERPKYYEAKEEHHIIEIILAELEDVAPSSDRFRAKAAVLRELMRHHIDEEERTMIPVVRRAMSDEELRSLGERMQQRKEQLTHGLDFEFGMARTPAYAARRMR